MRTLWLARRGLVAAFTLGAFLVLAGATGATTGALPGGTSIGVAISTPVEGSTLPLGPAVSLTGTAEVGTALPVANTLLMYVIDVSGSTSSVQATSVCGNQSVYDQSANTTLDCELLAVRDLNATAISNGTVAKVGIIGFGGSVSVGAATDAQILAMTGAGDNLIAPSANVTTPPFGFPFWVPAPTNNVQRVLASAYTAAAPLSQPAGWPFYTNDAGFMLFAPKEFPGNTNYWAALEKIRTLAQSSSLPNKMAIFLSDGASTVGGPSNQRANATTQLAGTGVKVFTFAVGPSASCSPAVSNFGTLEEISIATGAGHCVPLPNPANAVSAIPAVIASQLTDVKVAIDGAAATLQATTPATPRKGPDSVSFSSSITA